MSNKPSLRATNRSVAIQKTKKWIASSRHSSFLAMTTAYIILTLGAVSMLVPFFWMLVTSFMTTGQIFSYPPVIIPHPLYPENYSNVAKTIPVIKYFFNSAFVAIITTIGQVIISSMAAYAFARLNFKHREPLFLLLLATMMVPPQVNIIPLFFIIRELHWIDTYQALIIPGLFGGFGVLSKPDK